MLRLFRGICYRNGRGFPLPSCLNASSRFFGDIRFWGTRTCLFFTFRIFLCTRGDSRFGSANAQTKPLTGGIPSPLLGADGARLLKIERVNFTLQICFLRLFWRFLDFLFFSIWPVKNRAQYGCILFLLISAANGCFFARNGFFEDFVQVVAVILI